MIDFDTEIDRCLNIVATNRNNYVMYTDFLKKDDTGKKLSSHNGGGYDNAELIAKAMEREGLIERRKDRCDLTRLGAQIYKEGGWLKHIRIDTISGENEYVKKDEPNFDYNEWSKKTDEILEAIKRTEMGTEIVFNEIQEMKKTLKILNKKDWVQLLKGKLIDLTIDKAAGLTSIGAFQIFHEYTGVPIDKFLK